MKRLLSAMLFLLTWLTASTALAEAPAQVAVQPRDVPWVLDAKVPPIPASYQRKDAGWLQLAYVPGAYERVQPLLRDADEIKAKLAEELGEPVLDHVEVRIARTPEEMAQIAPAEVPYASGIAFGELHLVVMTLTAPGSNEGVNLDEVFRHELAHIALADAVGGHHVPRWFNEGLAVFESGEAGALRYRTLMDAALSGTVMPLSDLDRGFPEDHYEVSIAYAESADFVRFLLRKADRLRFTALIERVRGGQAFDRALADAYASDLNKLEYQWREELRKRVTLVPVLTGGSFVWVLVIAALGIGWVKKRRRARATLARWEREESAALAATARAAGASDPAADLPFQPAPDLPKVEHEGSWHTLH
jgi:hypothetical protein